MMPYRSSAFFPQAAHCQMCPSEGRRSTGISSFIFQIPLKIWKVEQKGVSRSRYSILVSTFRFIVSDGI